MSEELFSRGAEVLAKGLVLLGVAWPAAKWAAARGWRVWRAAFAALAVVTGLGLLPSLWQWTWPERPRRVLQAAGEAWTQTAPPARAVASGEPAGSSSALPPAPPARWSWTTWALLMWAGGAAAVGGWFGLGHLVAWRWSRQATAVADDAWLAALTDEAARSGRRHTPRLALHPAVPGPCTVGCRKATILLPPEAIAWDAETRRVVLRHELAHVTGRDGWFGLVRSALLAAHWPNPLVWLAADRHRREEEMAADRRVLAGGTDARRYAEILLGLARRRPARLVPVAALPMARLTAMEGRFQAILHGTAPSTRPWWRRVLQLGAFVGVIGVGCSSFTNSSRGSSFLNTPLPRETIQPEALERYINSPSVKAKRIKVRCRVVGPNGKPVPVDDGLKLQFDDSMPTPPRAYSPNLTLAEKQQVKLESIREFLYPSGFEFPEMKYLSHPPLRQSAGSFPVTPTTPTGFNLKNTGWTTDLEWIETRGAFFMLKGTFRELTFDGFIQCPGEPFSPLAVPGTTALGRPTELILTENQVLQPTFSTRETPFTIAARPGKTYRLPLNLRKPGCVLEIAVEPLPDGPR